MKKLIFIAAPPASGKTYVAEKLAASLPTVVYLDKDDLGDLMRASFIASGKEVDMDGAFYIENLRSAEYSTILHIAFSTLRFADCVMLNAPFGREVRDVNYMRSLRARANECGAELILIWVSTPLPLIYERMKARGADRDTKKLEDFEGYISKINYTPPYELASCAVDDFLIFDTESEESFECSLKAALKRISDLQRMILK